MTNVPQRRFAFDYDDEQYRDDLGEHKYYGVGVIEISLKTCGFGILSISMNQEIQNVQKTSQNE
jgi:hypothetical protein